jgi:sugar phosphate permease
LFLYDKPEDLGIKRPWEVKATVASSSTTNTNDAKGKQPEGQGNTNKNSATTTTLSAFWTVVIFRPSFWVLLIGDAAIYFIMRVCSEWLILLLVKGGNYSYETSSTALVIYEAGGVAGTLLSGPISDILGGKRNLASSIYCALLVVSLLTVWVSLNNTTLAYIALFGVGFSVNGPKTLAGIAVRESHPEAAGTAGGALGMAGQVGAAVAGYPIGLIIKTSTDSEVWVNVIMMLIVCSIASTILFVYVTFVDYNRDREKESLLARGKKEA